MKKVLIVMALLVLVYGYLDDHGYLPSTGPSIDPQGNALQEAFANRQSDVQLAGSGTVVKVLRDDLDGSRHQRFILKTDSGQSLLISHNIDLAPRINDLQAGDTVQFYGEYEWNNKGGVIHWTHHDPAGRHVGGWLKHNNKTYQ